MVFNRGNSDIGPGGKEAVNRSKTVLTDESTFVAKESYKTARTNIIFTVPNEGGCSVIMFTSSVPGEGKTTTCVNTAISFAQTGAKVLLIEADMRRPRVCECFNCEIEDGLSNVLGGFISAHEAIKRVDGFGIDVMASGWIPPNPAELLGSDRLKYLLDELKEDYDYIFIDTPPVNTVTDAVLIAKYVHGVIVVVRSKRTIKQALAKAINTLKFSNAKILGFMVNDSCASGSYGRYSGYKKYGNYYGNGAYAAPIPSGGKMPEMKAPEVKTEIETEESTVSEEQ